jgi:hypothetical protein
LEIDKSVLTFTANTGEIAMDSVTARNIGSSAIYYDWKKNILPKQFKRSYIDNEERFFCHHATNVIKPGEVVNFIFSFKSTVTGIFNE